MIIGYDAKRIFHNTTGLGNYSRDMIRILGEQYPDNNYLLYNPKPKKVHRLVPDGTRVIEKKPVNFIAKKLHFLWRSKWITKQLVKDKIDIYHGLTGELPYGIEKTNIKTIVTIHDLIFVRYPKLYKAFDRKIYLKKFQYAVDTADIVVAISEQTKRDIIEFLKINPNKIRVIYQGCHAAFKESFTTSEEKKVLKKNNIPANYILNVGAVNERKNVLSLVKAIESTNQNLIIVGSGTAYYQKVRDYVLEHQLEHQVFFLQNLSMKEIAVLYKMASLFVYPSIFEGFGIPIIEALYSKTPVITTDGSCFPEAGGQHTHYLKDPHNTDEIRNAILSILADNDKYNNMIQNGFDYAQRFNDDVIAKQMMDLYKSMLND